MLRRVTTTNNIPQTTSTPAIANGIVEDLLTQLSSACKNSRLNIPDGLRLCEDMLYLITTGHKANGSKLEFYPLQPRMHLALRKAKVRLNMELCYRDVWME